MPMDRDRVLIAAGVDVVRNPQLLEDLLAATGVRTRPNAAESVAEGNTRVQTGATGGDNTAAGGGLTILADLNADSPALTAIGTGTAPTRSVRCEFATSQARYLPTARDLVQTRAGQGGGTEVTGPAAIPQGPPSTPPTSMTTLMEISSDLLADFPHL